MADGNNYLPDRTINFNVCDDDGNILLGVGTVDLPSFQKQTDTLSGSGIAGEIDTPIPGHFQSMSATIHWRSVTASALELLADGHHSLTLRAAQNQINASGGDNTVLAYRIHLRGLTKNGELGSAEVNGAMEHTTELELTYIKILIDDEEKLELDKLNMIYSVTGSDQLSDVKKALGMG